MPHCDPVVNLYDQMYGIRKDRVEVVWPITARGQVAVSQKPEATDHTDNTNRIRSRFPYTSGGLPVFSVAGRRPSRAHDHVWEIACSLLELDIWGQRQCLDVRSSDQWPAA